MSTSVIILITMTAMIMLHALTPSAALTALAMKVLMGMEPVASVSNPHLLTYIHTSFINKYKNWVDGGCWLDNPEFPSTVSYIELEHKNT